MRMILTTFMVIALFGGQVAAAQNAPTEDSAPVQVMVLGTYHFEGAPDFNDVLAPEQQAEIRAVVDSLAGFRPTKIALEEVPEDYAKLDSLYRAYRAGRHELSANERQQLGFRLADRFGHERVYAVDHQLPWPNQRAVAWAREHRPSFLEYYERWREDRRAVGDSLQRNATVGEILAHMNSRESLLKLEELRMRKLELGAGSEYPGVAPTLSMYGRDLRIFANVTRIAEAGDRILVIYGAGHAYHLRDFVRSHPGMQLVEVSEYLAGHGDETAAS